MLANKQSINMLRTSDASFKMGSQCRQIPRKARPAMGVQATRPVLGYRVGKTMSVAPPKRPITYPRPSVGTHAAADGAFPEGSQPSTVEEASCTFTQAVLNVVNVVMGVGILSVPFALNSSGWAGIGMLMLMGYVACYSGKALVECSNTVVKKLGDPSVKSVGYGDIGEAAFGAFGKFLCNFMIYFELSGCCAMMFILMGDNMFNLLGTAIAKSQSEYMLLGSLLMIPTMWLPDLRALSFLGIFGLGATLSVACAVLFTLVTGSFPAGGVTQPVMWSTFPLVFGILTFCYSGHGVFPSIQAAMKEPEQFPQVLNVAFSIIATVCAFIGAAGYFMYGAGAADVIVFNLPAGLLLSLCSCIILINPIAKFAVTLEPVAAAVTKAINGGKNMYGLQRAAVRTVLAIAILYAARAVPMLALVMALLGSFLTISISITFPSLCHLAICKDELSPAQKAWDYFVVLLGITCTTLGTYASIQNIAKKMAGA